MPISDAIYEELSKFTEIREVGGVILDLQTLHIDNDTLIEKCRNRLRKLQSQTISKEGLSLAKVAHKALLALAEFKPLNNEDPLLFEAIEPTDVVYTSTGHQFSFTNLIKYHHDRYYRGSLLGEEDNNKWLLNPITNAPFDLMDVAHIQAIALQKGVAIKDLKTSGAIPVPPAPTVPSPSTGSTTLSSLSAPSTARTTLSSLLSLMDPAARTSLVSRLVLTFSPTNNGEVLVNFSPPPQASVAFYAASTGSSNVLSYLLQNSDLLSTITNPPQPPTDIAPTAVPAPAAEPTPAAEPAPTAVPAPHPNAFFAGQPNNGNVNNSNTDNEAGHGASYNG